MDIKPENILLDSQFNLKVTDFGSASTNLTQDIGHGTLGFMAPEIVSRNKFNSAQADLFSAGVLLFVMVTGHPPFIKASLTDNYYKFFAAGKEALYFKLIHNSGVRFSP